MAEDTYPTIEELGRLPLRLVVTYAVRCVRRAWLISPDLEPDVARAIDEALAVCDRFAANDLEGPEARHNSGFLRAHQRDVINAAYDLA
jgi:hypothetical protein